MKNDQSFQRGVKIKAPYLLPEAAWITCGEGVTWCTLCVNELTSNLLWTKYLFVLQHPATARLRAVDCFRLIQHAMPQLP